MGLLFEALTYAIRGCVYDVYNALGVGYDEQIYHSALEKRLKKGGFEFKSKVRRSI